MLSHMYKAIYNHTASSPLFSKSPIMQQCMNLYFIDSTCPIKWSVDSTGNHTQVHAHNYTSWNDLNCTKFTTRQRVTVVNSYIPVLLKLKGTKSAFIVLTAHTIRIAIATGLASIHKIGFRKCCTEPRYLQSICAVLAASRPTDAD